VLSGGTNEQDEGRPGDVVLRKAPAGKKGTSMGMSEPKRGIVNYSKLV